MRTRSPRGRRKPLLAAGLLLVVLVAAGYVTFRIGTHESSEPASVTEALARFRALPASARVLPSALRRRAPEPGVYVSATRGFEISHVLGTRRHAYPRRTALTVAATPRGCVRMRWDLLATRYDALLACPRGDSSWRLATHSDEHRFAGHLDQRTYVCTRTSTWLPAQLAPGVRWSSRCAIDGTTTADAGTVLGPRTLELDGRRTRTVLVRTTTRVSGDTVGVGTTFTWVLPKTRLVVRRTVDNANTTDTIVGDVRYEERVTLTLATARPRR